MLLIVILMSAGLLIGFIWVIINTIQRKGRMGINFDKVVCPKCGTGMPSIRKPRNRRQFLWGGGTCSNCGCEMDKWGKEIA